MERIQVDWSRYVDEDEEDQVDPDVAGDGGFGPICLRAVALLASATARACGP